MSGGGQGPAPLSVGGRKRCRKADAVGECEQPFSSTSTQPLVFGDENARCGHFKTPYGSATSSCTAN